jgi:hypothetical protein
MSYWYSFSIGTRWIYVKTLINTKEGLNIELKEGGSVETLINTKEDLHLSRC